MLSSRFKDAPDPQKGELDIVRHWFIKDIGRLQFIIPWAWNAIREIEKDGDLTPATMAELVMDAHDLVISALDTAYTFRKDNLALYGLEEEPLRDGVLPPQACEGLPEPWTSTLMIPENMKELVGRSRKTCETWFLKPSHAESAPNPDTVTQIAGEQAVIVHLCCQAYAERYRWCLGQRDSSIRTAGYTLQREYHSTRKELITKLAGIKFVDRAIDLAERYEDMPILVELFSKEFNQAAMSVMGIALPVEQRAAKERRLAMLQDRYVGYFHKFGTRWAHALFALHVRHGNLAGLLTDHGEWQEYLTDFLRANPALAKLSWINEVLGEQDYGAASKALLDLAAVKERDLWSKKVELSIGKLSLLAAQVGEEQQRQNDDEKQPDDSRLAQVDKNFELITIQERLYRHVAPSIRQAIDEAAEIDLVKKDFGSVAMKSMPALGQVLEQALNTLVARQPMNAEMLIDALTLIDHRSDLDSQSEVTGREFFLALRVVQIVYDEDPDKAQLLERIIWRRCMIRDDWTAINNTQLKRDRAVEQSTDNTALYTNLVAGFLAGMFYMFYFL
jgi:nuclear pore complex protein Nup133